MAKIPYIKWDSIYSVHVDILDEQHRKLFDVINELIDELEMGSNNLLSIIHELVNYLAVHFHQEHIVMMDSKYPDFIKHSQDHQRFTDQVEEFLKSYKQGDKDLGFKMILFMKDWIYNHTTKLDILYGDHLVKNADQLKAAGKIALNL